MPADSASIWGLRPHFAVVDELTQWHDSARSRRVWEGLTTGLAKVPDSRLAVICTAGEVGLPDKKSVSGLRAALTERIPRIKPGCIAMPMKSSKQFNIWLVIDLGTDASESRVRWVHFEARRVVSDKRSFPIAKHPSPRGGRDSQYVNRTGAVAAAA